MIDTKESADDGSSGYEEGVPVREHTDSESARSGLGTLNRDMVRSTDRNRSSGEDPFLLLGQLRPS
jgi:hypothetical protein